MTTDDIAIKVGVLGAIKLHDKWWLTQMSPLNNTRIEVMELCGQIRLLASEMKPFLSIVPDPNTATLK